MRLALVAPLVLIAGCAYYNGIYNARSAARSGDRLARRGESDAAARSYALAAATAESVLVRYPRSRWRPDALYFAGRGAALAGQCATATPRLTEFLTTAQGAAERRARASIALAACRLRERQPAAAYVLVSPFTASRDRAIVTEASLWAARASMALGDMSSAARHLRNVDRATAEWELTRAWLARGEFARAESLLGERAARGDLREELYPALDSLWSAGRIRQVHGLVMQFADARASSSGMARLHLAIARKQFDAGNDSLAALHLAAARRLPGDSLVRQDVAAYGAEVALRAAPSFADAERVLSDAQAAARGSARFARLQRAVRLIKLFERRVDYTGAALFLAAELARDSLRAPRLAHALYKRVEAAAPDSPLAPKALLAAGVVHPDSAPAYRQRVLARYAASPFALMLTDSTRSDPAAFGATDTLLRHRWQEVIAVLPDSVRGSAAVTIPAVVP